MFTALAESIAFAVLSAQNADKLREREELMRIAGRTAKIGAWSLELSAMKVPVVRRGTRDLRVRSS